MERLMETYYFDNFTKALVDSDEIDWTWAPPERYTLCRCYKGDDMDDIITEVWRTDNGYENVKYKVMDKYPHTNQYEERKRQLKGKPYMLVEVILPYSFFYRWFM